MKFAKNKYMKFPQDRIIYSPSYSPVLPHFPRIPTRIVEQVTQRQRYEFFDSPNNTIDLSYVIYHENHNKCYFFTDTGELKSAPLSTFSFSTKFVVCKVGIYIFQSPS